MLSFTVTAANPGWNVCAEYKMKYWRWIIVEVKVTPWHAYADSDRRRRYNSVSFATSTQEKDGQHQAPTSEFRERPGTLWKSRLGLKKPVIQKMSALIMFEFKWV